MSAYTRLERAVIQALAADLRDSVPDLARQFATARPTIRRNSGFGLFTEVLPPSLGWTQPQGPSGDFGSVHVMVGNLRDPIAFRVRLQNGRVMGLLGDSYGQDTRSIDFNAVPFDCVFLIDPNGRAVEVQIQDDGIRHAPVQQPARPKPVRQAPARQVVTPQKAAPQPARTAPQPVAKPTQTLSSGTLDALFGRAPDRPQGEGHSPLSAAGQAPPDDMTIRVGVWVVAFVIGLFAWLIFEIPFPLNFVIVAWLAGWATGKKGFPTVREWVHKAYANRAAQTGQA